ncbi:hypothetical protein PVAP13_6NG015361 [Panicum virgatum]|uniref:Uncharacterized protein n=1 Tax=Panicum virgatum TaxID=38727 RepID=A0A8T0QT94_PANVG|nr:hypothetical protein PVAP13_6NG015361 [Panicum virgatum]KAG2576254.1 hypothetical protein PVAP13_6NG015361 [Panicum virgatum]KAG2576255.1 hypothetical protein PVAP13_6NG015361 [Panicum virgatum]
MVLLACPRFRLCWLPHAAKCHQTFLQKSPPILSELTRNPTRLHRKIPRKPNPTFSSSLSPSCRRAPPSPFSPAHARTPPGSPLDTLLSLEQPNPHSLGGTGERLPSRVQIGRTLSANAAAMVRCGGSARPIAILFVRASLRSCPRLRLRHHRCRRSPGGLPRRRWRGCAVTSRLSRSPVESPQEQEVHQS